MGAAAFEPNQIPGASAEMTLLELVQAVADVTNDDREIVATVMYMLQSGHVRLTGNFRDESVDLFDIS